MINSLSVLQSVLIRSTYIDYFVHKLKKKNMDFVSRSCLCNNKNEHIIVTVYKIIKKFYSMNCDSGTAPFTYNTINVYGIIFKYI